MLLQHLKEQNKTRKKKLKKTFYKELRRRDQLRFNGKVDEENLSNFEVESSVSLISSENYNSDCNVISIYYKF